MEVYKLIYIFFKNAFELYHIYQAAATMKGLFAGIEIIKLEIECTFSIILLKKKTHSGFSEEEINHSEGSGRVFSEHCIHHKINDTVPK